MPLNCFRYPRPKFLGRLPNSDDLDRDLLYGYSKQQKVGKGRCLINKMYEHLVNKATKFRYTL